MIHFRCVMCEKELDEPGALLISSPGDDRRHAKYHICVSCETSVVLFITGHKLNKWDPTTKCPEDGAELKHYTNGRGAFGPPSYPFESGAYCPKCKMEWSDLQIAGGALKSHGRKN